LLFKIPSQRQVTICFNMNRDTNDAGVREDGDEPGMR